MCSARENREASAAATGNSALMQLPVDLGNRELSVVGASVDRRTFLAHLRQRGLDDRQRIDPATRDSSAPPLQ